MTALGPEAREFVRDRVIHVVGHELRTPLTTVRGLAELLVDASDEELHETLIPALLRNARRAERLLDDLLIAAEIETPFEHDADPELSFELSFRGEQAVTRAAGLGIGLPVARALARMDGGDVTIDQDDGTFRARLTLPRAR